MSWSKSLSRRERVARVSGPGEGYHRNFYNGLQHASTRGTPPTSVKPKNKFRIGGDWRRNHFCLCVSLQINGHGNELPELLDANDWHDTGRPLERTDRH